MNNSKQLSLVSKTNCALEAMSLTWIFSDFFPPFLDFKISFDTILIPLFVSFTVFAQDQIKLGFVFVLVFVFVNFLLILVATI